MKLIKTLLILIFLTICISCKTHNETGHNKRCPYSFTETTLGISICFMKPYVFQKNKNIPMNRIYFGPKTDWPFYDKYHPYMMKPVPYITGSDLVKKLHSIEKKNDNDSVTRVTAKQKVWVRKIELFDVSHIKVIAFYRNSIYNQCEEVVYTIIGKKYNYEITYPSCGGTVDEIFHFDARMYFKDVIKTMQFIE